MTTRSIARLSIGLLFCASLNSLTNAQTFPRPLTFAAAPGEAIKDQSEIGVGHFVDISKDLAPGSNPSGSWWFSGYFHSHGEKFGYLYHLMIVPGADKSMLFQTISVTEVSTGKHVSDSQIYPLDQAKVERERLEIATPSSSVSGDLNEMRITANSGEVHLNLLLKAASHALFNGAVGYFPFMAGPPNYEFGIPQMATMGTITIGGATHQVQGGSTWFDRQWSVPTGKSDSFDLTKVKWSWFGINLKNGDALSVWSFFDPKIGRQRQFADILHQDGSHSTVVVHATPTGKAWKSPKTNKEYPLNWRLDIPQLHTRLLISSVVNDQEISTPVLGGGYYQGVSNVSGIYQGRKTAGVARLELLGNW